LHLSKLQIRNFRNIASADIVPDDRLNLILGDNGAGKTSILESIVVLAKGRSFRGTQPGELIRQGEKKFSVYAETLNDSGSGHHLGIEREKSSWKARKNGEDLQQISQMATEVPLVVMEPNSQLLVSGPPEIRRKFLDWGVFHVEHAYLDAWKRYARALKQRNAAIRSGQMGVLEGIEAQMIEAAGHISTARQSYTHSLSGLFRQLLTAISPDINVIELKYRRGWSGGTLEEALEAARTRDLERGMTGPGPHRADLGLMIEGVSARHHLSRGEQKSVAAALLLAQAQSQAAAGDAPLVLLDDLASEFDSMHLNSVMHQAESIGGQVWLTGTTCAVPEKPHKMFHVEHGVVSEMV
jgi:DNA replication and repair protein RecF